MFPIQVKAQERINPITSINIPYSGQSQQVISFAESNGYFNTSVPLGFILDPSKVAFTTPENCNYIRIFGYISFPVGSYPDTTGRYSFQFDSSSLSWQGLDYLVGPYTNAAYSFVDVYVPVLPGVTYNLNGVYFNLTGHYTSASQSSINKFTITFQGKYDGGFNIYFYDINVDSGNSVVEAIRNQTTQINNQISQSTQQQTDQMTNGFDNSSGQSDADRLAGEMDEYLKKEDELYDQLQYEVPVIDLQGDTQGILLGSNFLQSLYVSDPFISKCITFVLSFGLVMYIVGWLKKKDG